jgi:hypothetical protein
MDSRPSFKRLRLRRADSCVVCGLKLDVGQEALWYAGPRVVSCVGCRLEGPVVVDSPAVVDTPTFAEPPVVVEGPPVLEGEAGASALREYERRRRKREEHARAKLGALGGVLARVVDEPQSTRAWKQGAKGEVRAGARLAKHVKGTDVKLLHDRRIAGKGNIDHLAVGPGGITVIDTKNYKGRVGVERVGGLFSERRTILKIAGRDQTKLIAGVETQIAAVRAALRDLGEEQIEIRGALCFANVDGLPLLRHLAVRDVIVDGPKTAARLASRPGPLRVETIDRVWRQLSSAFPPA